MSTTINGITVRLGRDSENLARYVVTVQATSRRKPGLKASHDIDPGASNGQQHLLQLIGAAGAACAEYLGEKHGDNIDPVTASRDAIRAFGEECRLLAAMSKDAPEKVKRLEAQAVRLKAEERELLSKFRWSLDHGERLTPLEVEWLNRRIGELHQSQL